MDKLDLILDELRSFKSHVNERLNEIDNNINFRFGSTDRKLDSIEDQVYKNTEAIEELKCKIDKQEVEIKVIKGGKSQV